MYNTFSNYLKIPRCALDDDNQLTKSEKTKAETEEKKQKQRQKKNNQNRHSEGGTTAETLSN